MMKAPLLTTTTYFLLLLNERWLDKPWTAYTETLSAARGARTERAADARLELPTRNFRMWAVHSVEERGQLASGSG